MKTKTPTSPGDLSPWNLVIFCISLMLMLCMTQAHGQAWINKNTTADVNWNSVTFGNGKFVAVARQSNQIMYSTDGITWTATTHPCSTVPDWNDVVFGNGIFVAVCSNSPSGVNNPVMYSSDGINWSCSTFPNRAHYSAVTFGNGLFVAVATGGYNGASPYDGGVVTSPDGINWTKQNAAAPNSWRGLTFANNLFVAVATTGTGDRVMTSTDGISWTVRTSPADNEWYSVAYGNDLFVAVSITGSGNRVMTSPDGINWTIGSSATNHNWYDITYGNSMFVAVSSTGTGNRVMSSTNGTTWNLESTPDNSWRGVAYGNNEFVAVGNSGTGNRAMIRTILLPLTLVDLRASVRDGQSFLSWETSREQNLSHFEVERGTNGKTFSKVGMVKATGNSDRLHSYDFWDNSAPQGALYYRLRQVDNDGRFSFSKTVRLNTSGRQSFSIGPNPTGGETRLMIPANWKGTYECRIITASGTVVYRQDGLRAGSHTLDLTRWAPGLYRVTLWENGESIDQQWVTRR